jgi:hypothetical protein
VVNYLRALQGKVPNGAGVGPVGYPGQNGATVPGYSATAPTRPAPHFRDPRGPMGSARPGGNAPAAAGEVRTPAEAAGQQGAPVLPAPSTRARSRAFAPGAPAGPSPSTIPSPSAGRGSTTGNTNTTTPTATPGARP